jgi:hypothetical protein
MRKRGCPLGYPLSLKKLIILLYVLFITSQDFILNSTFTCPGVDFTVFWEFAAPEDMCFLPEQQVPYSSVPA